MLATLSVLIELRSLAGLLAACDRPAIYKCGRDAGVAWGRSVKEPRATLREAVRVVRKRQRILPGKNCSCSVMYIYIKVAVLCVAMFHLFGEETGID